MEEKLKSIDVHVGVQVSIARASRDISLSDLAAKSGMSASALKSCEEGRTRFSPRELHRIAQCLQVELNSFFDGLLRKYEKHSLATRLNLELSNSEG